MKELARIGFYQTLANYEIQRQVLAEVNQKVINGGLSREEFESIKHYIVPSGLDVEKLILLNLERGFVRWDCQQGEEKLVMVCGEKGGEE